MAGAIETEEKQQAEKKDSDGTVRLRYRDMKPWQKKRLYVFVAIYIVVFAAYMIYTCTAILNDAWSERADCKSAQQTDPAVLAQVEMRGANATQVLVGCYIENVKDLSLKNSSVTAVMETWFKWEGNDDLNMAENFRVYKGVISNKHMVSESHENGVNYQLVRYTVVLSKNFTTQRFPIDAHQLHFYVESDYPVEQVNFVADTENCDTNTSLSINGYNMGDTVFETFYHEYSNAHSDPSVKGTVITSEFLTSIEIHRSSLGLYAKCFIALVGTIGWVLITLYINTFHHIDPLGMIPAALFGTVSNIMVGANLVPDALELGLLEYVNILGIMIILGTAISIINVNRIRAHYTDRDFARLFGRTMFKIMLGVTIIGNLALPLTATLLNMKVI